MPDSTATQPGTGHPERYRTLLEINNAVISNLTQDALFHAIAEALRRVVPFDRSAIFLHDAEKDVLRLFVLESSLPSDRFVVGFELEAGESHVGWAFRHQRPLLRRDLATERQYPSEDLTFADGVRSFVVVPLTVRGKSIGALGVASRTPHQYSEADAAFFQEAASQISLAIENMKTYEENAKLNRRLAQAAERDRTLLEINNAVMANLTQEALFRAITQALHRVVRFDRSAIFLHDPRRNVLRLVASEASPPSPHFVVGLELTPHDSHIGWVFRHGWPLLERDLAHDRQFPSEDQLLAEGIRSNLVVPLVAKGRAIGTLGVAAATPGQYTEADAALVRQVANQVALSVANMQAYEEIAALKARLESENVYLQEEIHREHNFVEMVGASPALLAVLAKVERVAPTDSTVLITGETGTGKELVARAIHDRSARKHRPLVKVNCSAMSAGLVESELFGHAKGAFTGALERRVGRFELADGGTIFLDEVGELPLETQVKLLRVLQEQEFEAVGSSRTQRVDVRVIAATNRDLKEAVRTGRLRADLFYRLNVFPLEAPPLRDRRSDIPQLVTFFLSRFAKRFGKKVEVVTQETMERLTAYAWPGNIRELQNIIERAVVLTQGPVLEMGEDLLPITGPAGLADAAETSVPPSPPPLATLEDVERRHILAVLRTTGWLIEGANGAARVLSLHPNTLRSRMRKLGLKRPAHEIS